MQTPFQPNIHAQFMRILQDYCHWQTVNSISPQLISPYALLLPLKEKERLQDHILRVAQVLPLKQRGGFSLSTDWHWDRVSESWQLIEINTNAAFLGLSNVLYEAWGIKNEADPLNICDLFLDWVTPAHQKELAIVDDQVTEQRLYCEFQWFAACLKGCFEKVTIKNPSEVTGQEGAIYNRLVDFYLEEAQHRSIREYFEKYPQGITPNPLDYDQVAHKKWLIPLSQNPLTKDFVPETVWVSSDKATWFWENRKSFFFKPAKSHASKGVYNGKSISRPHFMEMISSSLPYIAQKRIDPATKVTPQHGILKWDLRVYVHKGKPIQWIARFWQGQATNAQTPGGGFAPIIWVPDTAPNDLQN